MASTYYPMRPDEPAVVIDVPEPGNGRIDLETCRGREVSGLPLTSAQAYRLARALIVAAGVVEHGDDYDAASTED